MAKTRERSSDTAAAILDIAERLVQRRGFNGFSYADIAAEMGMTKASLHYHFVGKADLGERLIARYTDRFDTALVDIDAGGGSAADKLRAYCAIYREVLVAGRMCLCGMLAADYDTLPEPMRDAVVTFFDRNQAWLVALLEGGQLDRSLTFGGTPAAAAREIVAALEGAILVSRPYGSTDVLDAVVDRLLEEFAGS
ncbi:MAG TPA: TetR/AcrR family transcriptional regulator [Acidimicrobiales bacterium]|nr:TetR/AcrR family transcriptional regulator [Acidimicrobiales bacterium]